MIVVCDRHEKYFGKPLITGEKEPLDDKSETHGPCPICNVIWMIEVEIYRFEKETKRLARAKEMV